MGRTATELGQKKSPRLKKLSFQHLPFSHTAKWRGGGLFRSEEHLFHLLFAIARRTLFPRQIWLSPSTSWRPFFGSLLLPSSTFPLSFGGGGGKTPLFRSKVEERRGEEMKRDIKLLSAPPPPPPPRVSFLLFLRHRPSITHKMSLPLPQPPLLVLPLTGFAFRSVAAVGGRKDLSGKSSLSSK